MYASAGAGHKKAAEALYKVYQEKGKEKEVEIFDVLDYTNPFFKWFYGASYLFIISFLPFVWGIFYYLLDIKKIYYFFLPVRKIINFLNSGKLREKLIKEKPDLVLSLHFFASQVTGRLIAGGLLKTKLITVLTDFLPHYIWVNEGTRYYTAAVARAEKMLIEKGVAEEKIKVLGIPVDPIFSREEDKEALRKKLNLKEGIFVVLIVGGGFAVGPLEKTLRILDASVLNIEVVVVCGKNHFLLRRLKEFRFKKRVSIFGFVDNMHQLMKASDVIITKSGGLTTNEALACKLPMIIARPVPGQETRNSYVIVNNNLGLRIKKLKDLPSFIEKLAQKDIRENYLKNINLIARPKAASDIVEFADTVLKE